MKTRSAEAVHANNEPVDGPKQKKDSRIPEDRAGYMELAEAKKDGSCTKVAVNGGVSKELGCCNFYEPQSKETKEFRCGECEYLKRGQ